MQEKLAQSRELLTVMNVLRAVSEQSTANQTYLHDALLAMIEDGYASHKEQWVSSRKRIRVLSFEFDRMKADGIL